MLQPELEDLAEQSDSSEPVEVSETIVAAPEEQQSELPQSLHGLFIQIAATQERKNAENAATELQENFNLSATIYQNNGLHKLLAGPFGELEAARWLSQLRADGYEGAFRVEFSSENSEQNPSESSEAPE
nr:SPOR domain-containing protein [Lysobacter sp. N42]